MPKIGPKKSRLRGQGLVEFMLILPVILLVIFAIIEIARLLHAWMAIENGARFGVRYAVTGEFDNLYCAGYPGGVCDSRPEEDGARIPSIKDVTQSGAVAILRDPTVSTVGQQGFFKVTVCSNKAGVWYTPSDPNTPAAADCLPLEDPGGPGDRVSVTVDFDHPLITPIISSWWPVMHLSAKREGIVENFRTARVVGLPATISGPTWTPSMTPTASDTPTPSITPSPTATICKVPPEIEILDPPGGAIYNDGDRIPSQAMAWDPDNFDPATCAPLPAGPDGDGIAQVQFRFEWWDGGSWQLMYSQTENVVAYCGFGGNSPCSTHPVTGSKWPGGATMMSGQHRMRARALDDEGEWSAWEEVLFTLNPPPTPTPSPSPTPDCDDLWVRRTRVNGDDFEVQVQNDNSATAYLIDTWLQWPEMSASMYYNKAEFNDKRHYDGNSYSSPTSASGITGTYPQGVPMNGNGNRDWWEADFNNVPGGLAGFFSAQLTFNFPGWGTCVLTTSMTAVAAPTNTPRPPTNTATAGPSPTPSKTRTPRPTNTATPPGAPTATDAPPPTDTPEATNTPPPCTEC